MPVRRNSIQIITVQELLDEKKPKMPTALLPYFQAQCRDEVDEPMF